MLGNNKPAMFLNQEKHMARAYIESSVPSFYAVHPSRQLALLAKQQATKD
jgi:hypothetical protein